MSSIVACLFSFATTASAQGLPFYQVSIEKGQNSVFEGFRATFLAPSYRANWSPTRLGRSYTGFTNYFAVQSEQNMRFSNDSGLDFVVNTSTYHFINQNVPCAMNQSQNSMQFLFKSGDSVEFKSPKQYGDMFIFEIDRGQPLNIPSGTLTHDYKFKFKASSSETAFEGMGECAN